MGSSFSKQHMGREPGFGKGDTHLQNQIKMARKPRHFRSGPVNLMKMAPEMTRTARKDAKNGVVPRLSGLTQQIANFRPWHFGVEGCGPSARLQRRKVSKMNHISFAFSPRIQTDGLTPFPPN
ncbi:hypothetical protein HED49_00585 [Ochrobactrum daejeonense]|nr:hypothetical protein [Brucella daejeonensis]